MQKIDNKTPPKRRSRTQWLPHRSELSDVTKSPRIWNLVCQTQSTITLGPWIVNERPKIRSGHIWGKASWVKVSEEPIQKVERYSGVITKIMAGELTADIYMQDGDVQAARIQMEAFNEIPRVGDEFYCTVTSLGALTVTIAHLVSHSDDRDEEYGLDTDDLKSWIDTLDV